jgi:hypothetical protein
LVSYLVPRLRLGILVFGRLCLLDLVMGHDEFWEWSSGKVEMPAVQGNTSWRHTFRNVAILCLIFAGFFVVLEAVQWVRH